MNIVLNAGYDSVKTIPEEMKNRNSFHFSINF